MITLPKPKFAETSVPIGKSQDDYRNEIIEKQTHVLNDAIDRVSFWEIMIDKNKSTKHFHRFGLCYFSDIFFQLVHPSAVDPAGILMLGSVREVFELLGIRPESIQFRKEEFNGQNIIDALRNEPRKCPVITAADFKDYFLCANNLCQQCVPTMCAINVCQQCVPTSTHAMVAAGALKGSEFNPTNTKLADQWFIQCKNSYGNDPTQPGEIH